MVKKNDKEQSGLRMSSVESEDSVLVLRKQGDVDKRKTYLSEEVGTLAANPTSDNIPLIQSGTVNSTSTQSKPTTRTSKKTGNQRTSLKSNHQTSLTSMCSVEDSRASLFRLLENGRVSRILEVLFSLNCVGSHRRKDLDCCSLKMSKDSLTTIRGKPLERSSVRFLNWGMMSNGRCVTVRTMVSRRTGNGCSLSDILEPSHSVDQKYFLSEKSVRKMFQHMERNKEKGNGFGTKINTKKDVASTLRGKDRVIGEQVIVE